MDLGIIHQIYEVLTPQRHSHPRDIVASLVCSMRTPIEAIRGYCDLVRLSMREGGGEASISWGKLKEIANDFRKLTDSTANRIGSLTKQEARAELSCYWTRFHLIKTAIDIADTLPSYAQSLTFIDDYGDFCNSVMMATREVYAYIDVYCNPSEPQVPDFSEL